jgi:hypothetical protein
MTGLFVLGALASVAGIVILVVNNIKTNDSAINADAVTRHEFKLTEKQVTEFCEQLQGCAKTDKVMQFFIDDDNVIKVTVTK